MQCKVTEQMRRENGVRASKFSQSQTDSGEAISHRDACIPISDLKPAEAINSTEETEEN